MAELLLKGYLRTDYDGHPGLDFRKNSPPSSPVTSSTVSSIPKKDTVWDCMIYPELIAESFYYNGMSSIEEVEWQVTLYIGNKCNRIANQLHKIRDHLPSVHELADRARVIK